MRKISILTRGSVWQHGLLLGMLLALALSFSSSQAQTVAAPCNASEESCRVSGGFSAVSVDDPQLPGVTSPSSPAFGALVYPDFVQLENTARSHLSRAVQVRQSFSPYSGSSLGFDEFLAKLDSEAGLSEVYQEPTAYGTGLTRLEIIQRIEDDLAKARDIYAFLAIFAPEARFRSDGVYLAALCGSDDKEDPNPADPDHTGQVLPPVVDWCNFKARMRQSVREAATVRMMVGQEFMVDALGMNFSGGFLGGDEFVKLEVARLRAAQHQFELAEQFLAAGLSRRVGNGCLISDFYTQAEWSLLSRAAESQGTAHYLIGSRQSYLDINSTQSAGQAKQLAEGTIRRGANDGYIKLVSLAGLGRTPGERCAIGDVPDGDAVAEMALNLLDAQRQAEEIASGRNIFGFDVTFTPARAYQSSATLNCENNATANRGLWDEAYCSAQFAAQLQERAENRERLFDISQTEMRDSLNEIRLTLDVHIDDVVGCNRIDLGSDAEFFKCAGDQIDLAMGCLEKAHKPDFDDCMKQEGFNQANDITTALFELRGIYLEYQGIKKSADNINKRVNLSNDASSTVQYWLLGAGIAELAARVAQASLDAISCVDFDNPASAAVSDPACLGVGGANALAQTAAGTTSMLADISIEEAENKLEVENLLLDLSELVISAQSAQQAFFSKKSDVEGMLTALERDVIEAKRQRAYFATSPANDPTFRIVRDSARLELADALDRAAQISYLAARRAEYEYAARLAASNFRISDIYRARTAQDILSFLDKLRVVTGNLPGGTTQESTAIDLRVSVAKDWLKLTDDVLIADGFTTPEAIEAERARRFREWVAENTITDDGGKPRLVFDMTTSLLDSGLYANLIPEGYDRQWRLVLAGIGSPKPGSNGVSVNLVSEQDALSYRKVAITQGGMVHLRSQAGCIFDYRLIAPATLLGLEWAANQNPEEATALFNANVNEANAYTVNGFRTERFEGRAISATEWQVEVYSGAPEGGLGDMDLQQLTDIELLLSAVYSSRSPGTPDASDCARVDF